MGDDYFHVDKAMNDPDPGARRRTVFKAGAAANGCHGCQLRCHASRVGHRFCHKILLEIGWIWEKTIAYNSRCQGCHSVDHVEDFRLETAR